jgi:RHS repeat-associated protein
VGYSAHPRPLAAFDYLGAERRLAATFGNGAKLDYRDGDGTLAGLDGEGRVARQSWRAGADGSPLFDFGYARDGLGRLTAIRTGGDGEAGVAIRRDAAGAVVGFGDTSFRLDGAGNWLAVSSSGGERTATPGPANRYASFDGREQRHDADGRRLADGLRTYSWDALGRLREVREAGSGRILAGYAYDALGRRVARTDGDGATRYAYAGAEVVEERREGSGVFEFVLAAPGEEPFAVAEWTSTAATPARLLYAHRDRHPENVAAVTDERGALVAAFRYDAFGAALDSGDGASAWPYRFHGRRLDPATGLYEFGARSYDPEQGRFLSPDPAGAFGDPAARGNAYSLGPGNGVDGVDPTGFYWQELEGGGVKWMGKPGEEDYGFTTVKQLPGSWFEWRPDYVFEPTPLPPPRDPTPPVPDLPPPPEGSGWGTQLGISEDPLFYINARALDSKANAMLRDFVWVEAFSGLGLGFTRPLTTAMAQHPVSRAAPPGRYVEMGGMVNLTRGMKVESKFAAKIQPLQGWFDVVVHGSPTRVMMKIDGKLRHLDPQQLAAIIRTNPGWAKQNIRLVSCSTGASKCGFAAQLADELGVTVMAPTKPLWMRVTSKPGKVGVETVIEVAGVKKVGGRRLPNRQDPGRMEFFFPTPP